MNDAIGHPLGSGASNGVIENG